MAIGDSYATLTQFKNHLEIPVTDVNANRDAMLQLALDSASREIDNHCGRQFNKDVTPTARIYILTSRRLCLTDDFCTATGLVVKYGQVGYPFVTAWTPADYECEPLNGVVGGVPGWPYSRLVFSPYVIWLWPKYDRIEVTAQWGWTAVPNPVIEACLLLAATNWKLKDAALGTAGFSKFGTVKVEANPMACAKLHPYCKTRNLV